MKQTVLQKIVAWIFGAWCFVLAGINLTEFLTRKDCALRFRLSALAAAALAAAFCLLLAWLLGKLKSPWALTGTVFAVALAAQMTVAHFFAPPLFSDYETFYQAAAGLYRGQTGFVQHFYWKIWAYQYGFPWLLSLICRLFGNDSVRFCLAVNAVFSARTRSTTTPISAS